jgi:mono/diheme cytochrome c family protein
VRARLLLPAVVAAGLLLLGAACGTGGISKGGDVDRGKQVFVKGEAGKPACGSCHTLAAAGTTGTIGPNLDDAFAQDRAQGFAISSMQQVVADQIRLAACVPGPTPEQQAKLALKDKTLAPLVESGNCMPRNLVTGADVNSVAAFVAKCAGNTIDPSCRAGGGGGKITATNGKDIFVAAGCTGCHTLKDAGSHGTVGPNLDQKKPPKSRVITQVTNGGAIMPSFKSRLTKQQIDAVAAYVSSVAGK